jgi:hypothetical protein
MSAPPAPASQPLRKITRAVIVGINYKRLPYALNGCINDATNMQSYLTKYHNCPAANIQLLTDDTRVKPFKLNIYQAIRGMLRSSRRGDTVLFHYSGHGGLVADKSGDERGPRGIGMDSTIIPLDSMINGMITDDELRALFAQNVPAGVTVICVLDSCHSGTAVDLRYCFDMTKTATTEREELTQYPVLPGQVICLSGCTDAGYSQEVYVDRGVTAGAMTWLLIEMLKSTKKSGRRITWRELLTSMKGIMSVNGLAQTPQLSSGQELSAGDPVIF